MTFPAPHNIREERQSQATKTVPKHGDETLLLHKKYNEMATYKNTTEPAAHGD